MASGSTAGRLSFDLPGDASPWPASILLVQEAYVAAASRNETTARARSSDDHTVEVTFWIADPPAVSFYTFHCIKAPISGSESDSEEAELREEEVESQVAGLEGRFVLLRTILTGDAYDCEYFMYKGDPKSPSLESVPFPDDDYKLRGVEFAIVPRGDDGGHYLLIALSHGDYRLHIYSSEDTTWKTKEVLNPCPGVGTIMPGKVLTLGDGLLLWVDLLRGMLVCDVVQEPHNAHFVPLPEPLPGNRARVKESQPGLEARCFRDVTCVDGLIKFIEMERREIVREITEDVPPPEKPIDPRTEDVLYDSDLIALMKRKPVKPKTRIERRWNGWSAMTWTRKIGSNCWLKGRVVDVDDILVDDSECFQSCCPPESARRLTFKDLHSAWPVLSTDGNDILYLKSCINYGGGVLVAVDLAEKTLKVEAPCGHPFGKYLYFSSLKILRTCALANHLKKTPGTKISASQILLIGSSANEPNNTAIHVGETDSYGSENKRPRL